MFKFNDENDENDIENDENDEGWEKVDPIITQYAQDLIREMFSSHSGKKKFELKELNDLFEKKLNDYGGALYIFENHERFEFEYEDLKCLGIIINEMKKHEQKSITIKTYYA